MKAKKLGRGLWEGAYKPGDGRLEVKLNQGSGILDRKRGSGNRGKITNGARVNKKEGGQKTERRPLFHNQLKGNDWSDRRTAGK